MTTIGWIMIVIGGLFYGVGGLGVFRMPDVYDRAQAGTKATTLGSLCTLLGLIALNPTWWPKLVLIMLFILVTNPIGSSTLIRNAFISGVKPVEGTIMTDLSSMNQKEDEQ